MNSASYPIRYNPLWSVPAFVAGLLNAYVMTLPTSSAYAAVLAVLFLVMGALFVIMPIAIVSEQGVQVRNMLGMTLKVYGLDTLADLDVQGSRLLIRGPGNKPVKVRSVYRWLAKPADWESLVVAIRASKAEPSAR